MASLIRKIIFLNIYLNDLLYEVLFVLFIALHCNIVVGVDAKVVVVGNSCRTSSFMILMSFKSIKIEYF